MRKKGNLRKIVLLLGGFLFLLLLSFVLYGVYVYTFNNTERVLTAEECAEDSAAGDCSVRMEPRGGDADAWEKEVTEASGEKTTYQGLIYHSVITNHTELVLADWQLRINIHDDCYINNAWCGTVEIHQKTSEGENVQTLDLRNYKASDVTLDYHMVEQDIMIELHDGDYIIYHPSAVDRETPIERSDLSKDEKRSVDIGAIFYYQGDNPLLFNDFRITYLLNRVITQDTVFGILVILSVIWAVLCMIAAAVHINMKAAQRRMEQDERIIEQSLSVFSKIFEEKDEYTVGHSKRVADYTRRIAEEMGFSEEDCVRFYYIALMHDCGKYFVPDEILKKPGKLTAEEFETIKTHTTKGAELLEDFTSIEGIRDGALYHHEKYDGSGYPMGKKAEDIPLIGRIICVADSFDAMNSRRCYRDKLTQEHIKSEFMKNKGLQFDPDIVDVFMKIIDGLLEEPVAG